MGLRANNLSGMSKKERDAILEEQLATGNYPDFMNPPQPKTSLPPLADPLPEPQQQPIMPGDDKVSQKIASAKIARNPVKSVLSDTALDQLSASSTPEQQALAELIFKSTKAEEDSLSNLRSRIDAYEAKKLSEPKEIDFTPIAGLVDSLTGSNTLSYIKPPKDKGDPEKEAIGLREVLADRESKLYDRKIRMLEGIASQSGEAELERIKQANREKEIKLSKDLDLRNGQVIESIKARAAGLKTSTLDGQIKELNSGDKDKFSKYLEANQAIYEMRQALASGSNTFSPFGDNDFTAARSRYLQAIGRLLSGGQIGEKEAKDFKDMVPTILDSGGQQTKKLDSMDLWTRNGISILGVDPDQALSKRRALKSGDDPKNHELDLLLSKDPKELSEDEKTKVEDYYKSQGVF